MQKIIIQNFGPIKSVEIEITPMLVLIGEQATGKSTIAKLIYFFKSLSNDFLTRYYQSESVDINYKNDIIFATREKFYDYFGSTFHLDDFKITYYYNEERNITLSLTEDKKLNVRLSKGFFYSSRQRLMEYKKNLFQLRTDIDKEFQTVNKIALEQKQITYLQMLSEEINKIFSNVHNDSSFIVAGRNATIGYSSFFDNMLASNLQQIIENQGKRAYSAKEQTIDETLMLEFLQRVSRMKQMFNKFGNFEGLIRNAPESKQKKLASAHILINKIIRGEYTSSNEERIVVENDKFVYLKNASSGQQESIRILQDAFIAMLSDNKVFRIIEEPEAHIFPEAQMYLLQLLTMMLNSRSDNQIIITTHSPYVLSVLNNLMYAYQVGQQKPEKVEKIVMKDCWLDPLKVNTYMLKATGGERIIDDELCMIKAECIDKVSEILNQEYDSILNVEYEKE